MFILEILGDKSFLPWAGLTASASCHILTVLCSLANNQILEDCRDGLIFGVG